MHIFTTRSQVTLKKSVRRGYILLFTVLIISVMLGISLGLQRIMLQEDVLSNYLANSQVAFFSADTMLECALFWDRAPQVVSSAEYTIFATSSLSTLPPYVVSNGAQCNGVANITNVGQTAWALSGLGPTTANTTFTFNGGTAGDVCSTVQVAKADIDVNILADGYSNCAPTVPRRTQRSIVVHTNF